MNKSSMNRIAQGCQPADAARAFTLVELLVVIAVVSMLTAVAMSSAINSRHHVLRAHCASNLRQVGVGLNLYAAEANDYLPLCHYRSLNSWYTSVANRFPGYRNLGLLFKTKSIPDAKVLYCPGQTSPAYTYEHYTTTTNGWTFNPNDESAIIRAGYYYFPQLRITEQLVVPNGFGLKWLPKVTTTSAQLEYGTESNIVTPAKLSEVNPRKSITTDLMELTMKPHGGYGAVAGIHTLFPDGTVVFQNSRKDPQLFNPQRWADIGNTGELYRMVMNDWEP